MVGSGDVLRLTRPPVATTAMLIRRPVAEVFQAFVDPEITSKFWFTEGSGQLAAGERVTWTWGMYDVSIDVRVLDLRPDERILIEWPGAGGPTTVEWLFAPRADGATFVTITNAGFAGTGDEVAAQALDAMGGFTWVLAGLKAYLEHGIELQLVRDRYPAADA